MGKKNEDYSMRYALIFAITILTFPGVGLTATFTGNTSEASDPLIFGDGDPLFSNGFETP